MYLGGSITLAVFFMMSFFSTVSAQESSTTDATAATLKTEYISGTDIAVGDFVVGPGNIEVSVKPGESVTRMMTVTNRIADNKIFEITTEDMSGSADPSRAVVLLGDKKGPYTLKDYLSFPVVKFPLDLGERAQVPVTITMPADAQPGGYYGAVLVSTVQDDKEKEVGSTASSPIVARIGTLFFITVPGEVQTEGKMIDFSAVPDKVIYSSGPFNFGILFENTGSVYLNPYGEVKVTNFFNEEVGFLEIEPWFVLPKSLRLRELVWDRNLLLGRYTVTAKINRGYDDVIDELSFNIWIIPLAFIVEVFVALFMLVLIIKLFTSRFELKRK